MVGAGGVTAERPLADEEDGRQNFELGVGVDGGVGGVEQDRPREADVGTGEWDGLGVEGKGVGKQELEDC